MFYKGIKGSAKQFLDNYKSENPTTYAAAQQAIGGLLILDGFIGIDNPMGGKKRPGIFGSLIGVLLGLAFIFGAGIVGNMVGINKMTATTTATVVSVSQPSNTGNNSTSNTSNSGGSCTPQATYIVDGKEYTQTSKVGSSSACSLTQGDTIEINYDPNNPGAWAYELGSIKTVFKIFPIVGGIFVFIASITFVIRLLSIIFGWKLLKSGRALAKTLPDGTDLSTIMNEIKQNFAGSIFGTGIANPMTVAVAPATATAPAPTQAPAPAPAPEPVSTMPPPQVINPSAPNPAPAIPPQDPTQPTDGPAEPNT